MKDNYCRSPLDTPHFSTVPHNQKHAETPPTEKKAYERRYPNDLLRRLDQAEEKLVLTDKKYAELWNKYEAVIQRNTRLQAEINKKAVINCKVQSQDYRKQMKECQQKYHKNANQTYYQRQIKELQEEKNKIQIQCKAWVEQCNKESIKSRIASQQKILQLQQEIVDSKGLVKQLQFLCQQSMKQYNMMKNQNNDFKKQNINLKQKFQQLKINYEDQRDALQQLLYLKQKKNQQECFNLKEKILYLQTSLPHKVQINKLKEQVQIVFDKCEKLKIKNQGLIEQNKMLIQNQKNRNIKIQTLQQYNASLRKNKQQSQIQIYAEKLQNVQLRQQMEQNKQLLKKQYQLSIQNTRQQLQEKINKMGGFAKEQRQREKFCLRIKQLQKKYQMLFSEIITVDEIIGMISKTHKKKNI